MILLDTNVIIDAHYGIGNDRVHARNLISSAVNDTGAAINCITLAELYAGPRRGEEIEQDMPKRASPSWTFQLAPRRSVAAHTGAIGLAAHDRVEARLPACRCLTSSSARTQSCYVGSWPRGMSSGIAFIFLQSS